MRHILGDDADEATIRAMAARRPPRPPPPPASPADDTLVLVRSARAGSFGCLIADVIWHPAEARFDRP